MFKRWGLFTLIGAGLLVAGAATGLAWDEEEMSLSQVPAQVRSALLKLAGCRSSGTTGSGQFTLRRSRP